MHSLEKFWRCSLLLEILDFTTFFSEKICVLRKIFRGYFRYDFFTQRDICRAFFLLDDFLGAFFVRRLFIKQSVRSKTKG